MTGPGGRDRKRTPFGDDWCHPARKPSSGQGGGHLPDGPGEPGRGLACPSGPTPGGGGTYCEGCGLAPSGWRRRISRPSLGTPGAGTGPPSARRRCPAASPRVRPPPTRSPPRSRPRCCRRCECRRHRCRHCALPACPATRMRSVMQRGPGCGWVGPRAGVAWSSAARAGRAAAAPGDPRLGEAGSARPPLRCVPGWGLGLHAASLRGVPRGQAGWAPARAWLRLRSPRARWRDGGAGLVPPLLVALRSPVGQLLRAAGLLL